MKSVNVMSGALRVVVEGMIAAIDALPICHFVVRFMVIGLV